MSEQAEQMTICFQCAHCLRIEDGPRTDIWYNILCRAEESPKKRDPVTGLMVYVWGQRYRECSLVNMGACGLWSAGCPRTVRYDSKKVMARLTHTELEDE